MEQKSGLEFSGDGTAGYMHGTAGYMVVEKVIIVSVHVCYFSFFSFFSFFSLCLTGYVMLHQVTSGYVSLRQFTLEGRDVELDNLQRFYKCNIIQ